MITAVCPTRADLHAAEVALDAARADAAGEAGAEVADRLAAAVAEHDRVFAAVTNREAAEAADRAIEDALASLPPRALEHLVRELEGA